MSVIDHRFKREPTKGEWHQIRSLFRDLLNQTPTIALEAETVDSNGNPKYRSVGTVKPKFPRLVMHEGKETEGLRFRLAVRKEAAFTIIPDKITRSFKCDALLFERYLLTWLHLINHAFPDLIEFSAMDMMNTQDSLIKLGRQVDSTFDISDPNSQALEAPTLQQIMPPAGFDFRI